MIPADPRFGSMEGAKRFLGAVEKTNLALAAIAIATTHLLLGAGPLFWGVVAGAGLGIANWRALVWLAGRVIAAGKKSKGFYAMLAGFKLLFVLIGAWLLLALLPIEALGFLIGISTMMLSIFLTSFWYSLSTATSEEQNA